MKAPVLVTLFNKVALKFFIKKRLQYKYFSVNNVKFYYGTQVAAFDLTLFTLNDE